MMEGQHALVPARAHMSQQDIFPVLQIVRYLVRLIREPLLINRPARCQFLPANPLPIDKELIQPQSRGINYGLFDRFIQLNFLAQIRSLGIILVRRRFC